MARVLPVLLQVRDEAGDQDDVGVSGACHLVGDVQPVAERVAHGCFRLGRKPARYGSGVRLSRAGLVAHIGDVVDGADVAVAPPVHRLDQALRRAVVAERPSHLLDARGHGRLADEPTTPDRVHQLFLRHQPVAMADEEGEHVERLRFQRHPSLGGAKLEQRLVQHQASVQQRGHARIVARSRHSIST